jgi:hypothetical protein
MEAQLEIPWATTREVSVAHVANERQKSSPYSERNAPTHYAHDEIQQLGFARRAGCHLKRTPAA